VSYHDAFCLVCKRNWTLTLPYTEQEFRIRWDRWGQGGLIQQVFPELTPQQREGLKTGVCHYCWKRIFEEPSKDGKEGS